MDNNCNLFNSFHIDERPNLDPRLAAISDHQLGNLSRKTLHELLLHIFVHEEPEQKKTDE